MKSIIDKFVEIEFIYFGFLFLKLDVLFKVNVIFIIYGFGDIIINWYVVLNFDFLLLLWVGVEFYIEKILDCVEWYGRGLFECYLD